MPDEQELPIREFADRGTLWLLESPQNLHGLVRIVAKEIAQRLDFARAQRLNRSFVPDDLHKQEADLLYRVPFREGPGEVWVYVLLEHQSRPDRTMGLRLLSYMLALWESQRRGFEDAKTPVSQWKLHPIVPIVFYTGKRKWTSPLSLTALMDTPALLQGFVPQHRTLFLKLQQTPAAELAAAGSAVGWALRVLQAAEEPIEVLSSVLSEAVGHLEALPEAEQAQWRRAMHYLLLLIHHKRDPAEQAALSALVVEAVQSRHEREVEEMAMTSAQALEAKGRREGRKEGRSEGRSEGRKEGRAEGQLEMLLGLLEHKFGPLSEEVVTAVKALSEAKRVEVARRVLTAQTLAELGL